MEAGQKRARKIRKQEGWKTKTKETGMAKNV